MAKLVINTELNTKKFDAQILATEKKLNDLKSGYEEFSTEKGFNAQSTQAVEFRKEIEKTTNALIRLKEQQSKLNKITATNIQYNASPKLASGLTLTGASLGGYAKGIQSENFDYVAKNVKDLKNAFPDLGQAGEDAGERSGRGFDKGLKSLKRFGLALLGVRGMFTLVRRATSSYLSEHEETANKINSIWTALGNALAPIIETIADAVLYLIGYLNVFLQALGFDVDLTKNMGKSKKAIKETSGAMKELNRQVASFDEMNVAQKESSSGGVGGGADTSSAFKMPELNEGVVKVLKDIAGWLKENWTWLSAIAGLLIGKKLLDKFIGLSNVLGTLATIGVVVAGVDLLYNWITGRDLIEDLGQIVDYLKTMPEFTKKNTKLIDKINDGWVDWLKNNIKLRKELEKGTDAQKIYFSQLATTIEFNATDNKLMREKLDNAKGLNSVMMGLDSTYEEYDKRIQSNNNSMQESIKAMAQMYEAGQLDADQTKLFMEILKATGGYIKDNKVYMTDLNQEYNNGKNMVKAYGDVLNAITKDNVIYAIQQTVNLKDTIKGLNGITVSPTVKVKDNIDEVKNKLKNLAVAMTIGTSLNISTIKNAFGLAKGGIVNNPGRGVAMSGVITGEATNGAEGVIPMNNDEVMDMLGQKIARHIEINLTNNTMLDNKVIAREQVKLKSNVDFLTNGRGV